MSLGLFNPHVTWRSNLRLSQDDSSDGGYNHYGVV